MMAMASSSHLLLLLSLFFAAAHFVSGTDHIVGGHFGWNPNVNYTVWADNQTFYVTDLISFRYLKTTYNVFEVNQTGYDNCTTDGAVGNWSSGKDFILLDNPKRYYFICGNGFCSSGMKVSVVVHPLPSPPTAPLTSSDEHSSSKSAHSGGGALFPACCGRILVAVLVGINVGAIAWIGL